MIPLAIIGGTGVDELEGMKILREHAVDTPYGPTSRPIQEGRMGRATLFFLQRHGSPAAIPPHRINYRANLWAMKTLGAGAIVAINAVGGITEAMKPGRLLIPDQVVDYTWGREHTYADAAELLHVEVSDP